MSRKTFNAAALRLARELSRDADALDDIAEILRDPEWAPGMLEDIADIVRATGRDAEGDHETPTWKPPPLENSDTGPCLWCEEASAPAYLAHEGHDPECPFGGRL